MVSRPYLPDAGDLIWLTFDPQSGREQAGRRPALVLSRAIFNRATSLAVICPITRRAKDYPFEVALPENSPIEGVVLTDQIRSLDWRTRQAARIGHTTTDLMTDVRAKIAALLDL